MARASRHYIPGQVWHISHRCHKKEFLLKFEKDRRRWCYWLFEAKKRFGLREISVFPLTKLIMDVPGISKEKILGLF